MTEDTNEAEVSAFLHELVADAVGPGVTPRSGQSALARDMAGRPRVAGEAPTGVGKSFAALANAAVNARHGRRTLISTESLSLQSQIMNKDAPAAQATDARLRDDGSSFSIAVLKGWSNFVCLAKAIASAREAVGTPFAGKVGAEEIPELLGRLGRATGAVTVEDVDYDASEIVPALRWALDGASDTGDRADCSVPMSRGQFRHLSISSEECARTKCPLFDMCYPQAAKNAVAEADVIVTNHSVLAVQAAKAIPVILGNANVGQIDQVIVDEAHALPQTVRSQGQEEVSARRVRSLMRSAKRLVAPGSGTRVDRWFAEGKRLAEALQTTCSSWLDSRQNNDGAFVQDDLPLDSVREQLEGWAGTLIGLIDPLEKIAAAGHDMKGVQSARHIRSAVTHFTHAIEQVAEHRGGVARWVEQVRFRDGTEMPAMQSAPVSVSGMMATNLWEFEGGEENDPILPPERIDLISGTLQKSIGQEAGLDVGWSEYESPFDEAYGESLLFVPKFTAEQADQIADPGYKGRWRFSTQKHRDVAARMTVDLVGACSGGGIILSANSANGREYARRLRQAYPQRTILDQWSGAGVQELVSEWRDDQQAILIGTKSMMTGVDGPGRTCELVIIDRPARAQRNPVDEARVQLIYERTGDRWGADRYVYVADAAILLEQALGRLIRSTDDIGVAAILDCRLTKTSVVSYPTPTRNLYLHAARRFTQKTTSLGKALDLLGRMGGGRAAA
ncbi:ATP-dependent DNA helicase [Pseudoclavibacter sp. CFCC 13796]|uniref:ATP-dependent DNA helicase n=1 Tax=Pseudoclavibacter sp. CFCC 13796 TaxID=2615179 RepID=UPI001300FF6E|nr:helicase C-terminal domain-containing protein [Pseudoclavibacter sp. CFCC 13796]KAB1661616.1 ATP-dependent DNA helicase [Pseudoclavibacter sp. CFCC 13796]